jgi:predicted lipid carrier protein YhbT
MITMILLRLLQRKFGKPYRVSMIPKKLVRRNTQLVASSVMKWLMESLMSLNNKRYLVVRVRGCRSSESCVFKRPCKSIFKKGKMD